MHEQFGGEDGSHAGQADDVRGEGMLAEQLADLLVDVGGALGQGPDVGGEVPDDQGGGAFAGHPDGLAAGGGVQRVGEGGGVRDAGAVQQGRDGVGAGVPDRGGGLPMGEGEDGRRLRSTACCRAGLIEVRVCCRRQIAATRCPIRSARCAVRTLSSARSRPDGLSWGDVGAQPDGLGDDHGVAGVGLVFAGETRRPCGGRRCRTRSGP
ncbi:hypothetical protein [Krasilnikovia cinnamomea]|uniref:hypothetical protein n=1 Tax=Krasilnikovia cinnamomea TaxID=349313 RepID=UPI002414DBF5|nr:hypothetical protein [Krasilnikovia cinnamomea]